MKKLFLTATAAVALVSMVACSGKKTEVAEDTTPATTTTEKAAYTGIIPAADCDGIWYTLQLNDGKYDMIETYFALDTTANLGIDELLSVKSDGTYETVVNNGTNYLKLTPSVNDSSASDYYFLNGDSTLVLVNAEFELPSTPDYYTLNIVK
ncbi:MAG: copper resistance protein NlpE N-terminal domain-containing protein [Muribaculaceae bacterium]|nr:copper resistance protein NlpE N-terminal domain-containing protein [Muribaculaceae bacterium]MDE7458565.1 copper resistance protein NlpE N-terminal domain-containing protein [Muribaculaceae bacterium]